MVKKSIPWELHMAIIKLQASEECTYDDACVFASKMLEPNSEAFNELIRKEVLKNDRSNVMSTINKSKKTWIEKGRKKGYEEGYQIGVEEYRITYSCSVCGGELVMRSEAADHVAMKGFMSKAGWAHATCIK